MISDDPYRTSTQYRLFSFPSSTSLQSQRTKTNAQSRSQLPPEITYLTIDEEIELVDYYVSKLWDFTRLFKLPSHVKATATSYMLRYYLHNTPLTTHPKHLMLTALFLAAKTENFFIPIDHFKSQLPSSIDTSQLTTLEFPLSAGLQFSFTVWSCLRPLWGFGLDLSELINEGALLVDKDALLKIMDDSRQWALESLRTDAQFLYTPPQIALSCLFHFDKSLVRDFLGIKFPPGRTLPVCQGKTEDAAEVLLKTVVECDALISDRLGVIQGRSKEDTVSLVKGIDKKLWQCRKLVDVSDGSDTSKRKAESPDDREVKKAKSE